MNSTFTKKVMNRPVFIGLFILSAVLALGRCSSTFDLQEEKSVRMISESIEIDAPVSMVYQYLGNSDHARDWSVFVDHISPLNPQEIADGLPGSKRRCFTNESEDGVRWDEEIIEARMDSLRTLTIYNLVGFSLTAEGLVTNQLYEALPGKSTLLTFTLHFGEKDPRIGEALKTHIASPKVSRIFRQNLLNIKSILEASDKNQQASHLEMNIF